MTHARKREILINIIRAEQMSCDSWRGEGGSLEWLAEAMEITKEEAIELGLDKMYRPEVFAIVFNNKKEERKCKKK